MALVLLQAGFTVGLAARVHIGVALAIGSALVALLAWPFGGIDIALLLSAPLRLLRLLNDEILLAVPLMILMTEIGVYRSTGARGRALVSEGLAGTAAALLKGTAPPVGHPTSSTEDHGNLMPRAVLDSVALITPPSVALFVLADRLGDAVQDAEIAQGVFAPDSVSVRALFLLAFIPTLLIVAALIAWRLAAPRLTLPPWLRRFYQAGPEAADGGWVAPVRELLLFAIPPFLVIAAVLLDVATPAEAAALGVAGAIVAAARGDGLSPLVGNAAAGALMVLSGVARVADLRLGRLQIPLLGYAPIIVAGLLLIVLAAAVVISMAWMLRNSRLTEILGSAAVKSADIFLILVGGTLSVMVFRGLGGDELAAGLLRHLPAALGWTLVLALGAVLAAAAGWPTAIVLTVPIGGTAILTTAAGPTLPAAVSFGILFLIALQAGVLAKQAIAGEIAALQGVAAAGLALVAMLLIFLLAPSLFGT